MTTVVKLIWSIVLVTTLLPRANTTMPLLPQLQFSASIHGRVFYPNGFVASGSLVIAFEEGRSIGRQISTSTDSKGNFALDNMKVGVRYSVCASKQEEGYLNPYFLPFGITTGGHCQDVILSAGQGVQIDLKLAPKAGSIRGQVLDAHNHLPVDAGKVVVYRPLKLIGDVWTLVNPLEATWTPKAESELNSSGEFNINGLPRGKYFLYVEAKGYRKWFYNNRYTETTAQPLNIKSGVSTKMTIALP
jgi:hypothetical protein